MERIHEEFVISDERGRVDFGLVQRWLAGTYWAPGITRERVEKAAGHSALVVGAYVQGRQVGYCRVVSDKTRFAWVADVFVAEEQRGNGLGRAMVRFAVEHPELGDVFYWLLGTRDAHGVYKEVGFGPPVYPERLVELKREERP